MKEGKTVSNGTINSAIEYLIAHGFVFESRINDSLLTQECAKNGFRSVLSREEKSMILDIAAPDGQAHKMIAWGWRDYTSDRTRRQHALSFDILKPEGDDSEISWELHPPESSFLILPQATVPGEAIEAQPIRDVLIDTLLFIDDPEAHNLWTNYLNYPKNNVPKAYEKQLLVALEQSQRRV